jgi:hypothetical protein
MTNQKPTFDFNQIHNALKYIKEHGGDACHVDGLHLSLSLQSPAGCDIYTAIKEHKISLTFNELDLLRQASLLQNSLYNDRNFNSSDFSLKDEGWQEKRVCLTALGEVFLGICTAMNKTSH